MSQQKPGVVREFFTGASFVFRGMRTWATAPRLMFWGAVPALIVGFLAVAAVVWLGVSLESLSVWVTPFAEHWDEPWRTIVRIAAGTALLIVLVLLIVFTFTTVTLIVGQPFYERIWREVETVAGGVPTPPQERVWRTITRAIGEGLRMLVPAILVGLCVFLVGLIPAVGSVLAITLGALTGGWFLVVELTTLAFEARGQRLTARRRMLRGARPLALGFGTLVYLLFLIPGGAVVIMPAAVAGATLLTRRLYGEQVERQSAESPA